MERPACANGIRPAGLRRERPRFRPGRRGWRRPERSRRHRPGRRGRHSLPPAKGKRARSGAGVPQLRGRRSSPNRPLGQRREGRKSSSSARKKSRSASAASKTAASPSPKRFPSRTRNPCSWKRPISTATSSRKSSSCPASANRRSSDYVLHAIERDKSGKWKPYLFGSAKTCPGSARQLQHAHGPHAIRYHPRGAVRISSCSRGPIAALSCSPARRTAPSLPFPPTAACGWGTWRGGRLYHVGTRFARRLSNCGVAWCRPPRHGAHNSRRPGQFRAETPAGKRPGVARGRSIQRVGAVGPHCRGGTHQPRWQTGTRSRADRYGHPQNPRAPPRRRSLSTLEGNRARLISLRGDSRGRPERRRPRRFAPHRPRPLRRPLRGQDRSRQ